MLGRAPLQLAVNTMSTREVRVVEGEGGRWWGWRVRVTCWAGHPSS